MISLGSAANSCFEPRLFRCCEHIGVYAFDRILAFTNEKPKIPIKQLSVLWLCVTTESKADRPVWAPCLWVRSVPLLFDRGVVEKGVFRGVEYMLRHSTIYEKTDFYQAANNRIEVSTLCRELWNVCGGAFYCTGIVSSCWGSFCWGSSCLGSSVCGSSFFEGMSVSTGTTVSLLRAKVYSEVVVSSCFGVVSSFCCGMVSSCCGTTVSVGRTVSVNE